MDDSATPTPEPTQAPQEAPTQQVESKPEPTKEEPKSTLRAELRAQLRKDAPQEVKEAPKKEDTKVATEATTDEPHEAILAPADMSAEERAEFAKLPPAAQKYVSRRAYETRTNYTKKTEAVAARERELEQMAGINLSGLRDEYARHNIALPTVIENAVAWDRAFRQDPQQAAVEFLKAWGIEPGTLATSGQPQTSGMSQADIDRIVEERVTRALDTERQNFHVQSMHSAVESFKKDKPFFRDPGTAAQFEQSMSRFVKVLIDENPSRPTADVLEEAYRKTIASEPQYAELQQKFDGRAAAEKAKAEADRAIAASRSVSGGPGSGTPSIKPKNLREALRLGINGQLPRAG